MSDSWIWWDMALYMCDVTHWYVTSILLLVPWITRCVCVRRGVGGGVNMTLGYGETWLNHMCDMHPATTRNPKSVQKRRSGDLSILLVLMNPFYHSTNQFTIFNKSDGRNSLFVFHAFYRVLNLYIYTHTYTYIDIYIYRYVYVRMYICLCIALWRHVCVQVALETLVYIWIYIYTYRHIYRYRYIYI